MEITQLFSISNHNDLCESINALVDRYKERSVNISMLLVTKLVQVRKNLVCLGAKTLDDLYDIIGEYDPEFVPLMREYIHGRSQHALSQNQELASNKQQEIDVEIRSEVYQASLDKKAKEIHANKLKRIGKLSDVALVSLNDARARLITWLARPEKEKTDKKFVNPEKQFWSDQLRKAHNVHGMTYRRFDGSGTGIVGAKYTVEEKSSALFQTSEIQYYSTVPVIVSLQNDETMIKSFDHLDGGKRG